MKKLSRKQWLLIAAAVLLLIFFLLPEEGADDGGLGINGGRGAADYTELKKKALAPSAPVKIPDLPKDLQDPFKSISTHVATAVSIKPKAKAEVVKRNFQLKGIMNNNESLFAVVVDETGAGHVLSVGESFNGVMVLSISPGRVTLKDSYGTFTLIQQ